MAIDSKLLAKDSLSKGSLRPEISAFTSCLKVSGASRRIKSFYENIFSRSSE